MLEVWKWWLIPCETTQQAVRRLEEDNCFKYLESQVAEGGGGERDVEHRMTRGIERGER